MCDSNELYIRQEREGGDCLKTQTSSVKIDTKLVKMALNMDLKDKKMTKKIVFRQSGEIV